MSSNAKWPPVTAHLARGLLILRTSCSSCTASQYPAQQHSAMASVGATPIFTTLRPADAAKKPTKPTCASFKDAYDAATQRRCRNALIFSYAFSLLATIAFQLEFRMYFLLLDDTIGQPIHPRFPFVSVTSWFPELANDLVLDWVVHTHTTTLPDPVFDELM